MSIDHSGRRARIEGSYREKRKGSSRLDGLRRGGLYLEGNQLPDCDAVSAASPTTAQGGQDDGGLKSEHSPTECSVHASSWTLATTGKLGPNNTGKTLRALTEGKYRSCPHGGESTYIPVGHVAQADRSYSHSIVPGGLEVTS